MIEKNVVVDKNVVLGILAHVDSGKTTLSEAMLYTEGKLKKFGRVDHGNAYLDTHSLEKQRGITIFSKQAVLTKDDTNIFLLDTPGHVDFSTEMERSLSVLDYAVLVINGSCSLQNHTFTLWKLLEKYGVPTFIFVNKMDMSHRSHKDIIKELQRRLSYKCVDFTTDMGDEFFENIATCDEAIMEKYLAGDEITRENIAEMIKHGKLTPCYFGSALKLHGIKEFLQGFSDYKVVKDEKTVLSGKVFKISRDGQGTRLTHVKLTGGVLRVKDSICFSDREEKINQIRIYSGLKYETVSEAYPGMIIAVTGPLHTFAGEGFGEEKSEFSCVIEPVLNYRIILPPSLDALKTYNTIKLLDEEDPSLNISWSSEHKEIEIKLMGQIQTEILKNIIKDRFGIDVEFGRGNIIYKETISGQVTGIGHYEPLKHYGEVHLLIEEGERGSGIKADSRLSTDKLGKNWQRLIMTHIREKRHLGVLTGSELTDVEITLVAGRAHKKHTEGGDFRQATYRAIRQGLMKACSILLEPMYDFILEIPMECTGRAMTDLERMNSRFNPPVQEENTTIITGRAPVATMMEYSLEVMSYTRGKGRLMTTVAGYEPCHNEEEVVRERNYNPLADTDNSPDSVFCANGAGYVVSYDRVEEFMHITDYGESDDALDWDVQNDKNYKTLKDITEKDSYRDEKADSYTLDRELEEIFIKTYGPVKNRLNNSCKVMENREAAFDIKNEKTQSSYSRKREKKNVHRDEYLLVDGYNVIFAWEDLKELAKDNIDAARDRLMDILCNYQGIRKCRLMLVFDAYRVPGNTGNIIKYHNISVVYTREAETADAYIEKFAHDNAKKYHITVATSDGMEQIIIRGEGCMLISSRELREEIAIALKEAKEEFAAKRSNSKVYLFDNLEEDFREYLENVRLGKREM